MQNIPTKTDGVSTLPAAEFNQIPDELENAITDSGQSLAIGDLYQLSQAMSTYAAGGAFYTESGAADVYVADLIGSKKSPEAYFNGMEVSFIAGNPNTGASTINVATLGVKNIKLSDGSTDPVAGYIPDDREITLRYDGTSFRIVKIAPYITENTDNVKTITSSGNAITVDLDDADPRNPVFNHVMTENTTFTFSNPKATGFNSGFKLFLTNDGTGRTPTWPGSVIWPEATEPTLTTISEKNVLVFESIDGGTIWYGALAMGAMA